MSMSLDGYINDQNGSVEKLYSDFSELHDALSFQEIIKNTGSVVMGKRAFEMGGETQMCGLTMTMNFKLPFLS